MTISRKYIESLFVYFGSLGGLTNYHHLIVK
jgi:hypothetical protein